MDPDKLKAEIATILNQHDAAFKAMREAREAMHTADRGVGAMIGATRQMLDGVAQTNAALEGIIAAHGRAIDAAIAANAAALALLRQLDTQ